MKLIRKAIYFFSIFSIMKSGTPLEYKISITSGYDNNVMRFSENEFKRAASDTVILGEAKTFDSYITKAKITAEKIFVISNSKLIKINGVYTLSDFRDIPEKKYWSGGIDAVYRWGSYKNIRYSLRHLDKFYLRHYVDRDISATSLAPCLFTDRDQTINLSHRLSKNSWFNISSGYLQRYYARPFTEFDLDIIYFKGKINYRLKNFGLFSIQVNRGYADNICFTPNLRPSSFDRSYHTTEWFLPLKINKKLNFIKEIGVSARLEIREYEAEDPEDPLHSGRSHLDSKYDLWIKKRINEDFNFTLSSRFRTRVTDSEYAWVDDLKSFKQLQFWFTIEWGFIYDKY
ncbi:MAG: hypothetical protein CMG60_00035 [Candidatus Marinimicrobia bacterium]|nr:hypothetical protein [Candidatus Neomarinimicrobiota bacterium]